MKPKIIINIIDIYKKIFKKYPLNSIRVYLDDTNQVFTLIQIYDRKYRIVGDNSISLYWIESRNIFFFWVRHTIDFQDMLLARNAFDEIIKEKNYYQNIKRVRKEKKVLQKG